MPKTKSVDPNEILGRYLTSRKHFLHNDVMPAAFSPPRDLNLSVVRINNLSLIEIWHIGETEVIGRMILKKTLYGVATLESEAFLDQELIITHDDDPFPRHTSVSGWPDEAHWLSITQQLAAEATFVPR